MNASDEVTPPSDETVVTSINEAVPTKKARKEARRRRVLEEVENEENGVVSSPRVRKSPKYLKDFVCRHVGVLSPIYKEPEENEDFCESERL